MRSRSSPGARRALTCRGKSVRSARWGIFLRDVWQDGASQRRMLRKIAGFTAVAVPRSQRHGAEPIIFSINPLPFFLTPCPMLMFQPFGCHLRPRNRATVLYEACDGSSITILRSIGITAKALTNCGMTGVGGNQLTGLGPLRKFIRFRHARFFFPLGVCYGACRRTLATGRNGGGCTTVLAITPSMEQTFSVDRQHVIGARHDSVDDKACCAVIGVMPETIHLFFLLRKRKCGRS